MTDSPNLSEVDPVIAKAAQVYLAFTGEIKTRLGVIQKAIDELRTAPDEPLGFVQAESAILQLRNVCELMALSALAAHQPFGIAEELMDSWNARLAFRELAKINRRCFPQPIRCVEQQPDGTKHIDDNPKGLPTLRGLMRCYLRCGSLLHRGIVRHAFEGTTKLYHLDWIDDWATRIGELLVSHTMVIPDYGVAFIVDFYGGEGAQVSVAIGLSPGPRTIAKPDKAA